MKIQRTYGNARRKEQLEMINVMELKAQLKRTGMTQANFVNCNLRFHTHISD